MLYNKRSIYIIVIYKGDIAMSKSVNLYVVVPCYNEEVVLHETSKQMLELFGEMKNDGLINDNSRIVFVDDCV